MARLLFVTSRLPFPPREGHQLRSWHLLQAAARVHDVTLLSLRRPEDPETLPGEVRDSLGDLDIVNLPATYAPLEASRLALNWLSGGRPLLDIRYATAALRRTFRRRVGHCDLVHLDMLALAGLLSEVPAEMPSVLNEHNVEFELMRARLDIESDPWRRAVLHAQLAGLKRFESESCSRARCVLACSDLDAERLRSMAPGASVHVIPNGVDTSVLRPAPDESIDPGSLLFVGHMGWFPNRDGIEYFAREILPLLRRRRALHIDVIGRKDGYRPGPDAAAPIRFHGFVNDLEDRLRRAAVFIVPLRLGGGTRLKVLEAMAMGKAIVGTSKAVEGIGLVDGRDALIADTPEEFARDVQRVLDEPALRIQLGLAARRIAVDRFDWSGVGDRLLSVYDDLLGETGTRAKSRQPSAPVPKSVPKSEPRHGTA